MADQTPMTFDLETIDREKAQRYIGKNVGNRPVSQGHLNLLIGRQRRAEWKTNGDSIRFDSNGDLRDGQHRLHMVMLTGIPIEAVVIRGIDPAAFITMDTGKVRTITDVLAIKNEPSPKLLAWTLQWTYRYLADRLNAKIESHDVLLSVLDDHPAVHETVRFYQGLSQPSGAPGHQPITLGCHYLFSRVDRKKADDFIERYITGLRLEEENDPVGRLRGQIVGLAAARTRLLSSSQILGIIVRAWNRYYGGGKTPKGNYQASPRNAPRPKIEGFPEKLFIGSELAFPEDGDEEDERV